MPDKGRVFISVNDKEKASAVALAGRFTELGLEVTATWGTANAVRAAGIPCKVVFKVNEGRPNGVDLIDLIVHTGTSGAHAFRDEKAIRRNTMVYRVPCIITMTGARAAAEAIASRWRDPVRMLSLQEIHASTVADTSAQVQIEYTDRDRKCLVVRYSRSTQGMKGAPNVFPQSADRLHMERRLHPRTQVQFEAKVTNRAKPEQSAVGPLCDMSDSGISVVLPFRLGAADLVELEVADSLLTGRVIYSNPEESLFRTGIAIQKVQLGDSDLSSLLQRTLLESMPTVPGVEQEIFS